MNITLKISGRDLEFTFGLGFLGELLEETNLSIDEIVEKLNNNPFKMIPTLMFHSAKFAMERKGIAIDFNAFDMADMIDADGGVQCDNVKMFLKTFTDSMTKDIPEEKTVKRKAPKKKLTGSKT